MDDARDMVSFVEAQEDASAQNIASELDMMLNAKVQARHRKIITKNKYVTLVTFADLEKELVTLS
jgi:hypothetical protein